jgi:hypothetical protein
MRVPSTVKCSSDRNGWARATTRRRKLVAIASVRRRSRFFVNTVGTHTGSSSSNPTNQRNKRLYSSCSISSRSLRME